MGQEQRIERLETAVKELIEIILDMNRDITWQRAFDKIKEIQEELK